MNSFQNWWNVYELREDKIDEQCVYDSWKQSKIESIREAVQRHSFDASAWDDGLGTKLGRVIKAEDLLNMANDIESGIK